MTATPAPHDRVPAAGPVQSVTSLPEPPRVDRENRIRRYLVTMAIRTTCFLLAVVVTGPARWAFVAGAVVLPYIAVVLANAARPHLVGDELPPITPDDIRHLEQ
ncbi:MAG: DUF3099 domain-containing protein [Micrococcales bacterium]|nr:DUF3099 domain-containing protein [Micrococcales bacterium]